MKLSTTEFKYHKEVFGEDESAHKKMLDKNIPDEVVNMYEGLIEQIECYENYMFISTLTTLPSLFYQFPRPIIKTKNGRGSDYSASVIEATIKQYIDDKWKIENQLCILDTYLPYGYGLMKIGYNSRRGKVKKPSILTGEAKSQDQQGVETEEYLKFEKPVLERVSPKNAILDSEKPFHNPHRITFKSPNKSLQDMIDSGLYDINDKFIRYFIGKDSEGNKRKVKLDLYEKFCMLEGGVYKLCFVKEWEEPLFWGKTEYKELPMALLRFSKTPDVLYSVSHGKLAYNAQKELQYLNELWKQHVDKIRRQHLVHEDALTESGKATLRNNDIDGIVTTNRPVNAGVYAQIGSNPMGKDVYANIDNVRQYLKMLLNTTGGKAGENDAEFAETEKQNAAGDFMRSGGMQDNIRDFVRKQLRLTVSNIYYFASPELTIKITGKDIRDPNTGEIITGKYLQIGGEDGLNLQDEIKGDVDTDYLYDCDITNAARPDFAVVRKQLTEALTLATNLRPLVQEKGKDIDIPQMLEDYLNSFDALPNPERYFIDLDPQMKQEMEMKKAMMLQGEAGKMGMPAGAGQEVPTEEAIQTGAEQVPL